MNTIERRASQHYCNERELTKVCVQKYCCTFTIVQQERDGSSTLLVQHRNDMYERVNNQRAIAYSWLRVLVRTHLPAICAVSCCWEFDAYLTFVSCAAICMQRPQGACIYVQVERTSAVGNRCYCSIRMSMINVYIDEVRRLSPSSS